jgi:hypothetical protein
MTELDIEQYTVLSEIGRDKLIQEVNSHIQKGWQLLGGVSTMSYVMNKDTWQSAQVFSQALVKYKKSNTITEPNLG